jgi:hypothetical protein
MDEVTVKAVFYYYCIFWAINVTAYAVVSIGLFRWLQFVRGMGAEQIVRGSLKVTAAFASARMIAGAIGISLYELNHLSAISTILVLGVTSLMLNTTFIMTEGWFLWHEAKTVLDMPEAKQITVRSAIETFDKLRRAADAR